MLHHFSLLLLLSTLVLPFGALVAETLVTLPTYRFKVPSGWQKLKEDRSSVTYEGRTPQGSMLRVDAHHGVRTAGPTTDAGLLQSWVLSIDPQGRGKDARDARVGGVPAKVFTTIGKGRLTLMYVFAKHLLVYGMIFECDAKEFSTKLFDLDSQILQIVYSVRFTRPPSGSEPRPPSPEDQFSHAAFVGDLSTVKSHIENRKLGLNTRSG